jgi:hypothetical protein
MYNAFELVPETVDVVADIRLFSVALRGASFTHTDLLQAVTLNGQFTAKYPPLTVPSAAVLLNTYHPDIAESVVVDAAAPDVNNGVPTF